jgi:hypothetical protein
MKLTLRYFRPLATILMLLSLSHYGFAQVVDSPCLDGTVSAGQSICPGSQPANIILTSNKGAIIKWQSSQNPDFSTPTDISVTSSVLSGATIGAIAVTTYFRAVVQSDTCTFAASDYSMVSIKAAAPNPGSISRFTLFTAIGAVTNTGITTIRGDIGTNSGDITGFEGPSVINGLTQNTNAITAQATADVNTLYATLKNTPATNSIHVPVFGNGETLNGGVYAIQEAASVAGNLTLDAQGDPDRIFIFRALGQITIGAGTTVTLVNGAVAANVFWMADGAIVIGAASDMKGILVANGAISMGSEGVLQGNMFSTGGIISTQSNTITPALPVGGIVLGGATICSNTNNAVLTLSGYNGNIIKWQSSTVSDFSSNISDIANTTATLINPIITGSTWFRAVIYGSGCAAERYSETAALIVNSTVWNGNSWSQGIPTVEYSAVFNGNYNSALNGGITACSLTVNTGNVVVATNDVFEIKGVVTVTGGSFTIEDNGSLIQQDDVENVGEIRVVKNSNLLYRLDYTLWSSPVTGQKLQSFSPLTLANRFYTYGINSANEEKYFITDSGDNFKEGAGYLIRMPNTISTAHPDYAGYNAGTASYIHAGNFTGVPNNGDVFSPASQVGNFFSLVGNPYPSPIKVQELFSTNASSLSNGDGIYLWRKRNNSDATSYATLNTVAYIANDGGSIANTGGILDDVNGGQQWESYYSNTSASDWILGVGQGFFVKGNNSGNPIIFNNNMRSAATLGQPFFRMAQPTESEVSRLWLNLTNENNLSQIAIVYTPDATIGIDFGMDSRKFSNGDVSLYSFAANEALGIQARPAFTLNDLVPIGYKAATPGNYSINLHRKDGLFMDGQPVYLKDKLLGLTHNLVQGAYNFITDAGMFNNRFEVIYTNSALSTENNEEETNNIIIYKNGQALYIDGGKEVLSDVTVWDITGRIVYQKNAINLSQTVINDLLVEHQMLVVSATTISGASISKKIIY